VSGRQGVTPQHWPAARHFQECRCGTARKLTLCTALRHATTLNGQRCRLVPTQQVLDVLPRVGDGGGGDDKGGVHVVQARADAAQAAQHQRRVAAKHAPAAAEGNANPTFALRQSGWHLRPGMHDLSKESKGRQ
jgi:hypothetical protein